MITRERLNELLRECEVEIANANFELNILTESDEDLSDEELMEIECLMEKIVRLQGEYESLLQTL